MAKAKSKDVIVERKIEKSNLLPIDSGDVKYYDFRQNNSGGSFDVSDNFGQNVIIAARDMREANRRAEEVGLYFDGCSSGLDCDCCGDRWSEQYSESTDVKPAVYSRDPEMYLLDSDSWSSTKIVIFHADGTRESLTKIGRTNAV